VATSCAARPLDWADVWCDAMLESDGEARPRRCPDDATNDSRNG
jgi:hypothetical protein